MKKRKKAAIAAVTTAAAAGLLAGTLFDTPADLLGAPETSAVAEVETDSTAKPPSQTVTERLRQRVLTIPATARLLVGVPLWCLGWVLLSSLSALWSGLSPLAGRLVGWLCLAALVLAVFAVAARAAFPKLPLRRILRPGTVLLTLGVTLALGLADMALPSVWQSYDAKTRLVWRLGASCLLAFLCYRLSRRCGKTVPPPSTADRRSAAEEAARVLADSVTPKR